ncbi:catecholate siderophore receptor Fiu [Oxalicibacterium faecigallinarum]|uniref:Catecholate siderophore receptor Fiu n=1 Tax=Oxalicibacterium faecigallinarum TaxID=573741 RepID=A0A8J3F1G7_9BURK|nr:catecholate siderophore receptor Fiu [Oxalicibacterium faecigallinarum]GGI19292.1 catecholate siderophore receptor Fiu [Oxalicibacterium faecigallinarum]
MSHIKSRKHPAARHLNPTSAAVALAIMALPGATFAQQTPADTTLPEVRVSGQTETYKADFVASPKFTQPLVDTPQTIAVIKKEIFQQQNATTLSEALRNTPGITMQLGENGNTQTGDSIFMRGFDTSGAIFVDGIRDLGAISRDTFNLEQIEVVKGPSGSDNGRGASSGYVNLVSKNAQNENFASGSLTVGSHDRQRATVDLNRKLDIGVPGSAFRLNVMAQDYDVPGRSEVQNKRWGIAPSLAFGLGTSTRTTLNYLHIQQNSIADGGISTFGMPGYAYGALQGGPAVNSRNYYGVHGDHDDVTVDMFTAKVEHDIAPGTTIRNTTRIGRSKQDLLTMGINSATTPSNNPATYTVATSRQGRHQVNEILTNQTNLTTELDTGSIKHTLSAGFELIYERQNQATPVTVASTTGLYSPDINRAVAIPQYRGTYTDGNTTTAALYAFDTIKLSEQWMLNAGIRWDRFKTKTDSASFNTTTNTLTVNPDQSLSDSLLSWKVGAVFKPASNGSVYAGYSVSYQPPGGANNGLSATATNQANSTMVPQKGTNIEIGTKWELFDSKVSATAAIFRAENENEVVSDGGTPAIFRQIGKRRVDGVELGLVGQLTPNLNLSAGLAVMDAEIVRGTAANQGGLIVFSPKVTFTSWATYKLGGGFTIGGGARYVDTSARSSNVIAPTTGLTVIPDYWVADAMVSYEVNKNLSLQFNMNNLFDKRYITSINNNGYRYRAGETRNALLTANLKF